MNAVHPDFVKLAFASISASAGEPTPTERLVAVEEPVAIEVNGFGYAVLMATPSDLEDLAYGFALSERLIDAAADVVEVAVHATPAGTIVRLLLSDRVSDRMFDRVRHRVSESSCGLCGIENLEQALRPLPVLTIRWHGEDAAVFRALAEMEAMQPLNRRTHAVHGAAACRMMGCHGWCARTSAATTPSTS